MARALLFAGFFVVVTPAVTAYWEDPGGGAFPGEGLRFELWNTLGQCVLTGENLLDNRRIDLHPLSPGVYILLFRDKERVVSGWLVKE